MDEITNQERGQWAKSALQAYQHTTGADEADALCDLLADLLHLSSSEGFCFEESLAMARIHYEAEITDAA